LPTTTSGEPRKLRMLMRPKHSLDRLLTLKASGVHDLMGIHSPPCGRNAYDVGMPGARSSHELFIPSLPPAELSKLWLISHMKIE
jgi:hypothetical protein